MPHAPLLYDGACIGRIHSTLAVNLVQYIGVEVKYMATTNIFMNPYEQPENKLTYNFLCLVEQMENQQDFCEFLIDKKFELSELAVIEIQTVFSGYDSNPDGMISLRTNDDKECHLFFENKTHRMKLYIAQLKHHLETHCQNENAFLLVITPRRSDQKIVDSLNDNKVVFKTWAQVAEKLEHLPSFMAKQFVEYGKLSGEFENINEISRPDIDYYCHNFSDLSDLKSDGIFLKITKLIERLEENDIDFAQYGLKDVNPEQRKYYKWGRKGLDFSFNTKNNYVRWFFYGIYYNTEDHQIPFKDGVPELAFFFDVHPPEVKKQLSKNGDFIRALDNLEKQHGFEKNLTITNGNKKWRLLFKRVPLTELGNFSYQDVKKRFEKILSQLSKEKAFYQEMMAPPE